jgi:hypothetical protein
MDLNSVLSRYSLISFEVTQNTGAVYTIYKSEGIYCSGWFYRSFGFELERINKSELESMSAEELEDFAVGCSIRSMEGMS